MVDLSPNESFVALCAVEFLQPCINFHKDFLPRNCFLAEIHNELVNVPSSIGHMLCYDGPVKIYEDFSFWANHPFSLGYCIKGVTVDTPL